MTPRPSAATRLLDALTTIAPTLRARVPALAALLATSTGQLAATVAFALTLQHLFDVVIPDKSAGHVVRAIGSLLAVLAVATLVSLAHARLAARLAADVVADLQRRLVDHVLRLPPARVARAPRGDLLARFSTDLAPVAQAIGGALPYALMYALVVVGCLAVIAWIDLRAGAGAAALLVLGGLLHRAVGDRAAEASYALKGAEAAALDSAARAIGHHETVHLFGLRRIIARHVERATARRRDAEVSASFFQHLSVMLAEYGAMMLIAVAIGGAAWLAATDQLSAGALVAVITLLLYLQDGTYELVTAGTALIDASGGLARIRRLLDEAIEDDERGATASPLREALRFEGVHLAFDGEPVLAGLDLTIPRGQKVALVGRSGTGKSTLLRLLARLEAAQRGRVTWDGADITTLSPASLRAHLGVVAQAPSVLGERLSEAIRAGDPEASDHVVARAVADACLDDLRPDEADPALGADGAGLSGGERQRVALARALVRAPSVLLLDEVTSALDAETEARVLERLADLPASMTVLSVTHRLRVASVAERIVVLDGGRVVEDGDHAALVAAGGLYARLHEHQSGVIADGDGLRVSPDHLGRVPLFREAPRATLEALAAAFIEARFDAGDAVLRKGDRATSLFIIHRGRVLIHDGEEVLAHLTDGDCVGEMALLFDIPRTATARAVTPTSCLRLDRADFDRIVPRGSALEAALLAMARQRGRDLPLRRLP